ncbi:hypothetical protein VCRA2112O187_2460007 [Vibrio crassostreae]|nr:hypothetical protein VCRA2112O191_100022 [Vibrio crassostreae]CAK1926535.1 hypothetical protein VCRA2112O187_2460007 [Vibrio crassostreae]CAK2395399.1 hypothetical protein VCRA2116O374_100134 [Vibrio crassostreae]CAK2754792.1 hypothetical protein VCRA2113O219_10512 [Vibrio crassostreae]CAK2810165.1 hypothetical protein VCRA2133O312_10507 [Vibrio crassostreae]
MLNKRPKITRNFFCDKNLTKQIKGSESSLFVFLITKNAFFFNVYELC